jgi:hypothetical protein
MSSVSPKDKARVRHIKRPLGADKTDAVGEVCVSDVPEKDMLPFHQSFRVFGAPWEVSTNSRSILEAARESFSPTNTSGGTTEFSLRFWVNSEESAIWPNPHVRGLGHLVFVGFGSCSSAIVDLYSRRIVGRFSRQMAADLNHWKTVIFPILLTIVSGSLGVAEVHCACVAIDERGILLSGPSDSGKSTLSFALAQAGLGFLSDDRTFCSLRDGKLLAWSTPALLKLRSEAGAWFEEFQGKHPRDVQNGELVFRFDPGRQFGLRRLLQCEPKWLVFLERQATSGFCMRPIFRSEAAFRLEKDMIAEFPAALEKQAMIIDKLTELPCWQLQYGGSPQSISEQLLHHFERG